MITVDLFVQKSDSFSLQVTARAQAMVLDEERGIGPYRLAS